MQISQTPILFHSRCKRLLLMSSLRALKRMPKTEVAKTRRYMAAVDAFVTTLSDQFVGAAYTRLTGLRLEHAVSLYPSTQERLAGVSIRLTCPLGADYAFFQSVALARWSTCPVAGDHVYVGDDDPRYPEHISASRGWWQQTFGT